MAGCVHAIDNLYFRRAHCIIHSGAFMPVRYLMKCVHATVDLQLQGSHVCCIMAEILVLFQSTLCILYDCQDVDDVGVHIH